MQLSTPLANSFSIFLNSISTLNSLSLSKTHIIKLTFVCCKLPPLFFFSLLHTHILSPFSDHSFIKWNQMIVLLKLLSTSDRSSATNGFKVVKIVSLSFPVNHRYCSFFIVSSFGQCHSFLSVFLICSSKTNTKSLFLFIKLFSKVISIFIGTVFLPEI